MDVHRSRFVEYPTAAISAVAFSRSNDSGYDGQPPALKLAVGRANGNIEIWNPQCGLWVQETLFLSESRGIDGLVWTQDPDDTDVEGHVIVGQYRLFSIASSPAVTEWDLATGLPKRKSTGNFSELWCFAAQPRSGSQKSSERNGLSQDIVAGCGDGTIVLLSTADDDIQFKRFLARVSGKKPRCMCITYQNQQRIVAGFADGVIRVYDTTNGSQIRNMSLGVSVPGAPRNPLVWQVRCLPNGDIVSGDSNGEVRFWDGKKYSSYQQISGHDTDCLDLVTSSDGKTICSGSIDGKMTFYRQTSGSERKSFARNSHRRVHSGEVKAMAAYDGADMSVIVSGGSDATPMVIPLREYGRENLRSLPSLPQEPQTVSAPKARLLVSWWDSSISIWRIAVHTKDRSTSGPQKPQQLVARINLSSRHKIQDVSITSDGRAIAASTSTEVKVFQLRSRIGHDSLMIRKIEIPDDLASSGGRTLRFSPDGKWLATVTPDNEVYIARLMSDPMKPKRLQVLSKIAELERQQRAQPNQTAFKGYDRMRTRLAFSPDSSILVVSDICGYLDSWVLEGNLDPTAEPVSAAKHTFQSTSSDAGSDSSSDSDSSDDDATTAFYNQHWTENPAGHLLPKLESMPLILSFRPTQRSMDSFALTNGDTGEHALGQDIDTGGRSSRLWIMTANHQMFEFDVRTGRLSDWSRRNPSTTLPHDFLKIRDRVMGAVWHVSKRQERLWLYGSSFVCMLNVGVDLNDDIDSRAVRKRKKSITGDGQDDVRKQRKLESGAGGKIGSGETHVVKRYENGKLDKSGEQQHRPMQDGDEEEDDDAGLELTRLRRSDGDQKAIARFPNNDHMSSGERRWWCTFKYRPILGMVPLQNVEDDSLMEVAIVERPPPNIASEK